MRLLAFDVESWGSKPMYGLQPCRVRTGEAWLTSYALAFNRGGEVRTGGKVSPTVADMRQMLESAARAGVYIIGWNTAFDCAWLIAMGLRDLVYSNRWLDGMLLYKHLTAVPKVLGKPPYDLKTAVAKYYPDHAGYEEGVDFADQTPEGVAKRLVYNQLDARHTLNLGVKFLNDMTPEMRRNALIEAQSIPFVAEAMVEGITVDVPGAEALAEQLEAAARTAIVKLNLAGHAITEENIASPKQLSRILYEDWGLKPPHYTNPTPKHPYGQPSTDKDALAILGYEDERASLIKQNREARNNRTKFCVGIVESEAYNGDGCVRPNPRIAGTYTGRMTYSSKTGKGKDEVPTGVALHQWKRDKAYRRLIKAPLGFMLLEHDFSGQEYRWMAVESGDETMLQLCLPGEDGHAFLGAKIAGMDYRELQRLYAEDEDTWKPTRQFGKVGNLSCIAEGQRVLTDRGYVPIERVTQRDRVWDGAAWVRHGGVIARGVKEVISYAGIKATIDHQVLIQNPYVFELWRPFGDAAAMGWPIQPAMGAGRSDRRRAAVRILGGVVHRAVSEIGRALCPGALRLRRGAGRKPQVPGDRALDDVQGLREPEGARQAGASAARRSSGAPGAEAGQRHASALHQPEGPELAQLRRPWDRVSVRERQRRCGVRADAPASRLLRWLGHRPERQRRPLRAGQPAAGDPQAEPGQPEMLPTYDILDAGPRNRFVVGDCVVHNCQYRTSPPTLQRVGRTQYATNMSLSQAERIVYTYKDTYAGVPRYWRRQIAKGRRDGFVETKAGRRIWLGTGDTWSNDRKWGLESTCINFPIQGIGADQKYLGLKVLRDYLPSVDGRFYYELHDGLYTLVPIAKAEKAAHEMKRLLSNLPYAQAWGVSLPIQFPVDAKMGPSWGELKELH